jgi:transcriptional regulator with XRE-family HTH domain
VTAGPKEDGASDRIELGAHIRQLRTDAGLTMSALADAAGVSQSLISQIERGLAEPSLGTLRRIASVLGTTVGALFVGGPDDRSGPLERRESQLVVRSDARKHLRMPGSDVVYELMVPDLARKLEVIRTELPSGSRVPGEPSLHQGEETVVCLRGAIVCVHGDEEFELGVGDAISWDPSVPHWVENRGQSAAEVLAVITPPSF